MYILNLKIALRNLLRNKTASLINISGLAIGLAACLMLLLYVSYEWNYDKGFKNADRIHQVMFNFYGTDKTITATGDQSPNTIAGTLKEEMPEVEHISRILWPVKRLLANGKNKFKVEGRYADPEILKIFDFQVLYGNLDHALSDANAIVLTASTAQRLFGRTDVLNKVLRFENQVDLKVTAVIKDLPANVSYNFDCLNSWKLFEQLNSWVIDPNWHNYSFYTLLTLKEGTDIPAFNEKIKTMSSRHAASASTDSEPFVYPLADLHLYGKFINGKPAGGQIEQLRIFTILALSILIIACINFMNLSTARSQKRAKEVGIKKTIGASRKSLISQFLMESLMLTFVSVIIAVVLVELCLPKFNHLLDIKLEIAYGHPLNWLGVIALIFFTGILAGSYPAFFLSSFNPIQTLKKTVKQKSSFSLNFRQILVIVQFSFAVILIVATLIIYEQLQYIRNKPLGYQVKALVEMPHEGNLYLKYDLLKERLLSSGAITAMCHSSASISQQNSNSTGMEWQGMSEADKKMSVNQIYTGYDFVKTNGLKLLEGRDFKKGLASDSVAVMLSESAVKRMRLVNPVGKIVVFQDVKRQVVGVFKDIIWGPLTAKEKPMIIAFNQWNSDVITMRLNTEKDLKGNLEIIGQVTREINPDFPVDIRFLDNLVAEKMKNEATLGLLSNLFGSLAIFISCLGLFGLSAFSAEQRTKEIGVRKVLGASVSGIVQLLSVNFVKTVMIALFIAMPVAYLLMKNWLNKFDYHISIGWQVFLITGVSTVMIALLTVSWQAYRAAKSNPVDALKYE